MRDHRVVGHEQGRAVEGQLPGAGVAERFSLAGQTHEVNPGVLAPVLVEFF
jgi:hypothetical protein